MSGDPRGDVPMKLKDGRRLTLNLKFSGLVAAERAYGQPLHILGLHVAAGFAGAYCAMLFGALQKHHDDIDLDEASEIFAANDLAARKALVAADKAAYPDPTGDKKPGNRRPGTSSGRSGARPALIPKASGTKARAASR